MMILFLTLFFFLFAFFFLFYFFFFSFLFFGDPVCCLVFVFLGDTYSFCFVAIAPDDYSCGCSLLIDSIMLRLGAASLRKSRRAVLFLLISFGVKSDILG